MFSQSRQVSPEQAAAAEKALKELQQSADARVEGYIKTEAVSRGFKELKNLTHEQKAKFMDEAIA